MIQCPKCKAGVDDDSWYCDQCGQQLMMCPKCREPRKGKRCTTCVSILVTAEQLASQPASAPHSAPKQPQDTVAAERTANQPEPGEPQQPTASGTMRGQNAGPQIADTEPSRFVRIDDPSKVVVFKPNGVIGRTTGDYLDVFSSCCYVSSTHGKITLHSSMRWLYTDLGSTNGTLLEGKELEPNKNYLLKKGQTIEIGILFQKVCLTKA